MPKPSDESLPTRNTASGENATVAPSPWRVGLAGARANLVPGICLQIFAIGLLAAYYFHPASRSALEAVARFRVSTGVTFDIVSTAFFGAILPFAVLKLRAATRTRYDLPQMAVITAFWAYKGMEVSFFYRVQAWVFGEGTSAATIIAKTLADQYVYCPLIAIPATWLVYAWTEHRFDSGHIGREVRRSGFYARCVLPILIANWGIWTPAVAIIYLLPTALQLPLQNIVLCFFTLLLSFVTRRPQ